ncbi:MAG: hypothetical protein IT293_05045 [Deltaproteobacteria bacterium]|nr:hypothetical protein [Deltaproteobacteria bacterium]
MRQRLRLVIVVLGAFFLLQGVAWLVDPARVAAGLGMPLLDGLARSTQVGDFASFFLVAGATMLLGSRHGRSELLWVPAALIGGAAVTRTLAWMFQGAAFAFLFITVEVVVAAILVTGARRLDSL